MLEIAALKKSFSAVTPINNLSYELPRGAMLVLRGPSGCGKTTLLRLIAGLELPDSGQIHIGGICASGNGAWTPPHKRGLTMAFQDFALWPHKTAAGHIDFVLKAAKRGRRERRAVVSELLHLMDLEDKRKAFPAALSGGQQQRVNLARALAPGLPLLLLDEPFAHLDARLRRRVLDELLRRQRADGVTIVIAAHDQEALTEHATHVLDLAVSPP